MVQMVLMMMMMMVVVIAAAVIAVDELDVVHAVNGGGEVVVRIAGRRRCGGNRREAAARMRVRCGRNLGATFRATIFDQLTACQFEMLLQEVRLHRNRIDAVLVEEGGRRGWRRH